MSDIDKLFSPLNRTSTHLKQLKNIETDNCYVRNINKQFENAIDTYQKTKRRGKVVGHVSIKD